MKAKESAVRPDRRAVRLEEIRDEKMARSPATYVRGNTVRYYEWLERLDSGALPEGPAIWICGDCHVGNLGPVGNAKGKIEIQIRDLDQTVIGNPAHDLIRLSLSLASAARGSDLPGMTTIKMLERIMADYQRALAADRDETQDISEPKPIRNILKAAQKASWRSMAVEEIEGAEPTLPLGKRFWPLSPDERRDIKDLLANNDMHRLATRLRSRDESEDVKLVDAAYWVKGCSSLGRPRYALLLHVDGHKEDHCLIDIKDAVKAAAPRTPRAKMPVDEAERVVEGARHLSPYLGERMLAAKLGGKSMFVREIMPQDQKIEIERMASEEAIETAGFLAAVVGKAHSRQMDGAARKGWRRELQRGRSKSTDIPGWLWTSIVELLADHERGYLDHCHKSVRDTK